MSILKNKIAGCLLGGLIGDAMGAPVENWHYDKISERYGTLQDFEGEGTDDSAIKLILCEALLNHNGHITADDFAASFCRDAATATAAAVAEAMNPESTVDSVLNAATDYLHQKSAKLMISLIKNAIQMAKMRKTMRISASLIIMNASITQFVTREKLCLLPLRCFI